MKNQEKIWNLRVNVEEKQRGSTLKKNVSSLLS